MTSPGAVGRFCHRRRDVKNTTITRAGITKNPANITNKKCEKMKSNIVATVIINRVDGVFI